MTSGPRLAMEINMISILDKNHELRRIVLTRISRKYQPSLLTSRYIKNCCGLLLYSILQLIISLGVEKSLTLIFPLFLGNWMPQPTSIPSCPQEIEYLTPIDPLLVPQKVECIEAPSYVQLSTPIGDRLEDAIYDILRDDVEV